MLEELKRKYANLTGTPVDNILDIFCIAKLDKNAYIYRLRILCGDNIKTVFADSEMTPI